MYHPKTMREWMETGDTSAPVTVKIDLTNVCNHNCPGCIDADLIAHDNNELHIDLVKNLLNDDKQFQKFQMNCHEKSKKFDWKSTAKELENLYNSALI